MNQSQKANNDEKNLQLDKRLKNIIEPIAEVFFSSIFLILVNMFWDQLGFLSQDFSEVLPLYNLVIITGIILSFIKIFLWNQHFILFTKVVNNVLFVLIAWQVWIIFPFNLDFFNNPSLWETLIKILIVFPPIAYTISTIVESAKIINNNKFESTIN